MGMRVCSVHGCPHLYEGTESRCASCKSAARAKRTDNAVYSSRGHRAFRAAVLERDEICVLCEAAPSNVADHYPMGRRELVEYGADPNDEIYGRGLCDRCHNIATANNPDQRGGWNNR